MDYRPLRNTDSQVSRLGLGASPLGSVFREVTTAEARMVVNTALELGINLIDVVPLYGLGRAEARLGAVLRDIPRADYLLSTKVGRYGWEIADCDFSATRTRASLEQSLGKLGVDHVDVLRVHDVEFGDPDQIVEETLPTVAALKAAGKAWFIGITGLPLELLDRLSAAYPVDAILSYCRHTLNDTALLEYLPRFTSRGIGLVQRRAARRRPPERARSTAPEPVRAACRSAAAVCRAAGEPIEKLAIQFATAHPEIPTTLVGSASAENIANNVRWIDEPLDRELLAAVLEKARTSACPSASSAMPSPRRRPPKRCLHSGGKDRGHAVCRADRPGRPKWTSSSTAPPRTSPVARRESGRPSPMLSRRKACGSRSPTSTPKHSKRRRPDGRRGDRTPCSSRRI